MRVTGIARALVPLLAAAAGLVFAGHASADPEYIYGFHDPGGESNMGSNKGWIVWTEAIGTSGSGGGNYSSWSSQGYGVIVRLNNGYGSGGTLPYQSQYDAFASRCANYIQNSSGVSYWIIGNETNLPREWPGNNNGDPNTGEPITVARYVDCYNRCYNAIKAVVPSAKLCPTPSGTWAPPYPSQGIEGFVDYWVNILNGIGASKIDGLILHAYTHGCDPALVTSEQKMGAPYTDIYYHFRVYKNFMWRIPASMNTKPVLITESNENVECATGSNPAHAWSNTNSGWVRTAYSEINTWNANNAQKIRCLALFRWPVVPEGAYTYGIADKSGVIQDFQQAVAFGYKWGTSGGGNCAGLGTTNPSGSNLSLSAATYVESGRNNTDQYGESALDGNTATKWCCNTSQSGGTATLAVDLGSTATVTGYIVRHAETGGEANYLNTKYYRIESAGSLLGPWTTEWDVDNSCQDPYNRLVYGTAKSLRYVRLVVTNPGIDSYLRLPEFEIYGTAGSAQPVTIYAADYSGGVNAASGTDYYDTTTGNSGGAYRSQNVDIESSTDGYYDVGWMAAGEWLSYPLRLSGAYTLYARCATPNAGTAAHFELNGAALTGSVAIPNTGGWQTWQTVNCGTVSLPAGWSTFGFVADTANFNVQRFWFEAGGMNGNTPTGSNLALTASQYATDSYYDANSTGAKAKDGVISAGSKWTSAGTAPPHWLKYDLGSTRTVNGYIVRHASAGGEPTYYNTQYFRIQASTGYDGPWVDETVVDNSAQAGVTTRSYTTPKSLRYVRLYIEDAGIDNYARIPEFEVYGPASTLTVSEDFNSTPSWTSTFDAAWGSAATFSSVAGGQSGNALQATRSSQGSSSRVKVYSISPNTAYTVSIYIKCPSSTASYWAECAYKLGSNTAQDFDANAGTWSMIKKFSDTGTNGNGNTWVQYSLTFNSGSATQISVGFKHGASGAAGPTVYWDTLRVQ